MKLLLALPLAMLVLLTACGDDDDGLAASVGGVWNGQMESKNPAAVTPHFGTVCIEFEQDGRELDGRVVFQGLQALPIGGRVANDTLSFVWNSGSTATGGTPAPVTFESGGTLSGTVADDTITGTWTSLDGDNGTWNATRGTAGSCG